MAYDYPEPRPAGSAMLVRDWRGLRQNLQSRHGVAEVPLPPVRAALSNQITGAGAALIPDTELAAEVEIGLATSVMRRVAEVRQIADAADYNWPVSAPSEGELVGPGAAQDAEDPTFAMLRLGLYKFGSKKFFVPNEWWEDARERGVRALVSIATRRIARNQNRLFTVGTGAGQPQGIVNCSTYTVQRNGTSLVFDDLVNLYASLAAEWWEDDTLQPAWMMNPLTFAALTTLKDGSGQYVNLLRRNLFESPILFNPHMPVINGNNTVQPILFGRFDQYKVRDGDTIRFVRSLEAVGAIEQDQSLCFATLRSDGGLLVADPTRPPVVALQLN